MSTVRLITFRVDGIPATKGSARAVKSKSTGKALLLASASTKNAREQKTWARAVGWACRAAMRSMPPMVGPVDVQIVFFLPRPKTVKTPRPISKHDGDKLTRATWDAMTGIAYVDDGAIVTWGGAKYYADGCVPGARITVGRIEDIETRSAKS